MVADISETEPAVEQHFATALAEWDARGDRGDVSARRRSENDARLAQWRLNADKYRDASGEIAFACECARYGCTETLTLGLKAAEQLRAEFCSFVMPAHR